MKTCITTYLTTTSLLILTPLTAYTHGWVEYPNARQNICYLDGGFWEDRIPNAACQAAFDQSGAYQFVQRNEISINVSQYWDMAQVKASVKDGSLCSAGDSAKSGLNIASPYWQKTPVSLDSNNQLTLIFHATAPHNPSYWEFYLSKPDYDGSQPLKWSDLELVDSEGDISVNSNNNYEITIRLPSNRSGDAILFTRWQREDPAGEGFYNCSDITLKSHNDKHITVSDTNKSTEQLSALTYFIPPHFGPVNVGDTIRLRVFDRYGQEQKDFSLAITKNHIQHNTWPAELAAMFNNSGSPLWHIGIWHSEMNHYMFDSKNLYANQVYAPSSEFNYQLSLIKKR
ncbi:spindolin [Vibrio zhanjiangensis]|uniref:Spindolin n=1 Tax=Vibrio zhanjiangensis TaxID=1046128 RepID=A0ABQ6F4F1_9VIBR|nr:lytic polysaccharide monooxygenase [Vibrio zhanjiangensis]GLT19725.1 spindolin [Vibrio zhanjiangensis]